MYRMLLHVKKCRVSFWLAVGSVNVVCAYLKGANRKRQTGGGRENSRDSSVGDVGESA